MDRKDKDMYLPFWVCVLGIFFLIAACVLLASTFSSSVYSLIGFGICLALGVSAILCWKNQSIKMIDENTFVYTTMFGRENHYSFSDIQELKISQDSFTLILDHGKVHIENCAIMSESFIAALDSVIKRS